ncbi:hypothetical protein BRADI_2g35013v3 [Brachypodium distachyon]|uniref:Uncharacterized protein n=1 Tax=Brachypodium distachyon TaxID=15368 RepID=A0A0Q3G7Q3_BRADI|nr:hypothetical protein BRADI_2g35013v3 [Brachypodium distachyon]PNT71756.1 hypothetical protein BRADI_2g35013v3 [Brachypodium distachyon]PNT71757.1 hypothetical protein BRADI_2g35013v3 [Brachypodium distachyon]PNT71758.1 hypothetical protein BRADI_2g35013v3 [Brachypodium distachyon]
MRQFLCSKTSRSTLLATAAAKVPHLCTGRDGERCSRCLVRAPLYDGLFISLGPQLTRPSPTASPALPAISLDPRPCSSRHRLSGHPYHRTPGTNFRPLCCCWCSAFACDSCSGETMYRLHCDY